MKIEMILLFLYENRNDSFIKISKDNNKRDIGEKKFSQKRKALYS